jgi:hypothetical protein
MPVIDQEAESAKLAAPVSSDGQKMAQPGFPGVSGQTGVVRNIHE